MQCNYNSFIQIINFCELFRNALRCRKTGACRILVPLRYIHVITQICNIIIHWFQVVINAAYPLKFQLGKRLMRGKKSSEFSQNKIYVLKIAPGCRPDNLADVCRVKLGNFSYEARNSDSSLNITTWHHDCTVLKQLCWIARTEVHVHVQELNTGKYGPFTLLWRLKPHGTCIPCE